MAAANSKDIMTMLETINTSMQAHQASVNLQIQANLAYQGRLVAYIEHSRQHMRRVEDSLQVSNQRLTAIEKRARRSTDDVQAAEQDGHSQPESNGVTLDVHDQQPSTADDQSNDESDQDESSVSTSSGENEQQQTEDHGADGEEEQDDLSPPTISTTQCQSFVQQNPHSAYSALAEANTRSAGKLET